MRSRFRSIRYGDLQKLFRFDIHRLILISISNKDEFEKDESMNKLWDYKDYVNHLSHENRLVRRWAFNALENHYPNIYTDKVCNLISDEDEHLACAAPRYLSWHGAVQHAPAILESFKRQSASLSLSPIFLAFEIAALSSFAARLFSPIRFITTALCSKH